MNRSLLYRVITIPEQLQTALYVALLGLSVQLEVYLTNLVSGWLGQPVDFTGAFSVLVAAGALVITALAKKFLEAVVPEKYHSIVNSFLVWLAGFFGALAYVHTLR